MFELVLTEIRPIDSIVKEIEDLFNNPTPLPKIDYIQQIDHGMNSVVLKSVNGVFVAVGDENNFPDEYTRHSNTWWCKEAIDLFVENRQTIAYAAGSITAFAVFARNVIGSVKDWQDVAAKTRSRRMVHLKLDGKEIEVREGDDLVAILEQHWPPEEPKPNASPPALERDAPP